MRPMRPMRWSLLQFSLWSCRPPPGEGTRPTSPAKPPSCRPGALTRRSHLLHNENCWVGQFLQNLLRGQSVRQEVQDVGHPNAHASDAGPAAALLRVKGYAIHGGRVVQGSLTCTPKVYVELCAPLGESIHADGQKLPTPPGEKEFSGRSWSWVAVRAAHNRSDRA